MARPTEIKEWGTGSGAVLNEPSFTGSGFPESQPSYDHFNWLLNNIYKWIDFLSVNVSNESFFYKVFQSTRPRIALPFVLVEGNKLASLQVLKRVNGTVGSTNLPAYEWEEVTTGLSIETLSGIDFIVFDVASGVVNGDILLFKSIIV